jgi:hypothetical protein
LGTEIGDIIFIPTHVCDRFGMVQLHKIFLSHFDLRSIFGLKREEVYNRTVEKTA